MNKLTESLASLIDTLETHAPVLRMVETDTVKAKFLTMPVTTTALSFIVQFQEPMALAPTLFTVNHSEALAAGNTFKALEAKVLAGWNDMISTADPGGQYYPKVQNLTKVELVQCELSPIAQPYSQGLEQGV